MGSTGGVGPDVVGGGGEAGVVAANVLKVGAIVVGLPLGVVTASVTSSVSSKVSPRATEGRIFHFVFFMKKSQELYPLKYKLFI